MSRNVELNTAPEELYFAQKDRSNVDGVGDDMKMQILEDGRVLVRSLADEALLARPGAVVTSQLRRKSNASSPSAVRGSHTIVPAARAADSSEFERLGRSLP